MKYTVEIETIKFNNQEHTVELTGEKQIVKRTSKTNDYNFYWEIVRVRRLYKLNPDRTWSPIPEWTGMEYDSGFRAARGAGAKGNITVKTGYLRQCCGDLTWYKREIETIFVRNTPVTKVS